MFVYVSSKNKSADYRHHLHVFFGLRHQQTYMKMISLLDNTTLKYNCNFDGFHDLLVT